MSAVPRRCVAQLAPYVVPELTIPGFGNPIRLCSNESGFGPSSMAVDAVLREAARSQQYSDDSHIALRQALARVHDLDFDRIVCGAGSAEILSLISQSYLEPGRSLVMSAHGYRFPETLARAAGADVIFAPETSLTVSVDAMIDHVRDDTAIMFLVNPNNPTGTMLKIGEIERLLSRLPDHVLLLLDSAYGEFVDSDGYETGERFVDEGFDVVVLRTFSKIHGLAGMRIGWAYAPEHVADTIRKVNTLGSVSTQSQAAATAALDDVDHCAAVRRQTIALRKRLEKELKSYGLEPVESEASFVLVRVPPSTGYSAEDLYQAVKSHGILLRRTANFGLPDYLRVSIGSVEEMNMLSKALSDILGRAEN